MWPIISEIYIYQKNVNRQDVYLRILQFLSFGPFSILI